MQPVTNDYSKAAASDRVLRIASRPNQKPNWNDVQSLTEEDLPALKKLYLADSTLTNRSAVMFALAVIGDEEVVDMFQYSLFKEFDGRKLSAQGTQVLTSTVAGLGILANRSDRAYELLKAGLDRDFWHSRRTWQPELEYSGFPDYLFVNVSFQGLALSGRLGFSSILDQLPQKEAADVWNISGGVVTSALLNEIVHRDGREAALSAYLYDGGYDALVEWKRTAPGQAWQNWKGDLQRNKNLGLKAPPPPKY